jgi:hypothetical protein
LGFQELGREILRVTASGGFLVSRMDQFSAAKAEEGGWKKESKATEAKTGKKNLINFSYLVEKSQK